MGYKRAEEVLPLELLEQIQEYVAGESIYIPRRKNERRHWGEQTETRKELTERNLKIKKDYSSGFTNVWAECPDGTCRGCGGSR